MSGKWAKRARPGITIKTSDPSSKTHSVKNIIFWGYLMRNSLWPKELQSKHNMKKPLQAGRKHWGCSVMYWPAICSGWSFLLYPIISYSFPFPILFPCPVCLVAQCLPLPWDLLTFQESNAVCQEGRALFSMEELCFPPTFQAEGEWTASLRGSDSARDVGKVNLQQKGLERLAAGSC